MAEETKQTKETVKVKGKKGKRIVTSGQVHIKATFNNTIISVSDKKGQVLSQLAPTASVDLRKVLLMQHKLPLKKLAKLPKRITVLTPSTFTSKVSALVAIVQFAHFQVLVLKLIV